MAFPVIPVVVIKLVASLLKGKALTEANMMRGFAQSHFTAPISGKVQALFNIVGEPIAKSFNMLGSDLKKLKDARDLYSRAHKCLEKNDQTDVREKDKNDIALCQQKIAELEKRREELSRAIDPLIAESLVKPYEQRATSESKSTSVQAQPLKSKEDPDTAIRNFKTKVDILQQEINENNRKLLSLYKTFYNGIKEGKREGVIPPPPSPQ